MPADVYRHGVAMIEGRDLFDPELVQLHTDLGEALDQLADLRDRLDKALASAESHQAARGRAVNAVQIAVSCMERHRDVLQRAGLLDDAAQAQEDIKRVQELCR